MICIRCRKEYGYADDLESFGEICPSYEPYLGRCFMCDVEFFFEMYGEYMEPVFGSEREKWEEDPVSVSGGAQDAG